MLEFHFLRPWILVALPVIALLCYFIKKGQQTSKHHTQAIAPHLARALTPKQRLVDKLKPIDFTFALAALLVIACAGPAWFKQVDGNDNKAPLIVLLKVSDAMLVNDVAPTRLTRAKQKITDLLNYRSGAKTALFAFASSSHNVLPFTEDSSVFQPFLTALTPDVMPGNSGTNADSAAVAMSQAVKLLETQPFASIVLIADDISQAQVAALNKLKQPFIWWQIATSEGGVISADNGQLRSDQQGQALVVRPNSATLSSLQSATAQQLTLGTQDIVAIDKLIEQNYQRQRADNSSSPYQDMAWYFAWPVLLLCALWFRKGWTSITDNTRQSTQSISLFAALLFSGVLSYTPNSYANTADWFFTRDQQGMMAYNNKDYARAAILFSDPTWQAKALFDSGKYLQASEVYGSINSVDSFYNRATSLLKAQEYIAAIAGFQQVLKQQPNHLNAQRNLAIAEHALEEVMSQAGGVDAEQSITTEVDGNEISDKQDANSQDYQVTDTLSPEAKEQWMQSVDSQMGDFLKSKFANEVNNQRGQ